MHRLLVLYPEPDDTTTFTEYYATSHLPLVEKLPGLTSWSYSTDVTSGSADASPYFAVFQADFPDRESFSNAMESSAGQAVSEDVPNFATGGAIVLNFAVEGGKES
jgi:uncharacterized protein (TIGR02118 family)